MKCEEYLKFQIRNKADLPYICLRLPDVIGPYDDTGRFWAYIKWIQSRDKYNLEEVDIIEYHRILFRAPRNSHLSTALMSARSS